MRRLPGRAPPSPKKKVVRGRKTPETINVRWKQNQRCGKELCKPSCVCVTIKKWWTSFCFLSPEHSLSLWSWSHPRNVCACQEFCTSKNLTNVTVYELIRAVVFLSHSCTFKGIEVSLKRLYSQRCNSSYRPTYPLTVYAYSAIYQDLEDEIFFCTDPESSVHTAGEVPLIQLLRMNTYVFSSWTGGRGDIPQAPTSLTAHLLEVSLHEL